MWDLYNVLENIAKSIEYVSRCPPSPTIFVGEGPGKREL